MKLLKFIRIVTGLVIFGVGLVAQILTARCEKWVDVDGSISLLIAGLVIPSALWIAILIATMFSGLTLAIGKSDEAIAH